MVFFRDRADAGRRLAAGLTRYDRDPDAIVLALPRGGVPVAFEVADALHLPLDIYTVRKLGVPGHEELAMGAVASDGSYVVDEAIVESCEVTAQEFRDTLTRELAELERRESLYRSGRPPLTLAGKTVIVVDDGLATGASMYSAVRALRRQSPREIAVAVPVAPAETCRSLERSADRVFCPHTPGYFGAVGLYYGDFGQVDDAEVRALLELAHKRLSAWKVA